MQSRFEQMNNKSFFNLEEKLYNMLKPVRPDPVFIDSLKTKLSHTPSVILESSKKNIGLLVVGAGLFAGALTLWILTYIKKIRE
ncbi:MAG: Uncharacterized protein FD147_856 [Chloroflexi bacterium]|nr:MAG: Uncharacterized protein FD147_856 [Chloroflexota bacterium]MBA4375843.1 hypothetical protein [Anaerolinea sp.]